MENLCQLNGGCFGCCPYGSKHKRRSLVTKAIEKNTEQFLKFKRAGKSNLEYRDRYAYDDFKNGGICRNLVFMEDGNVGCAVWDADPENDLRRNYCEQEYNCIAKASYDKWEQDMQEKFLEFLKQKDLDWYSYSCGMNDNSLIYEFLKNLEDDESE